MSKAFDNGMIRASEQAVIADKEIYADLVNEFKSYGVYFVNKRKSAARRIHLRRKSRQQKLRRRQIECRRGGQTRPPGLPNKPASACPKKTNILVAECSEVGPNEPLTRETLARAGHAQSRFHRRRLEIGRANGGIRRSGHSAAIHTADEALAKTFGERVEKPSA